MVAELAKRIRLLKMYVLYDLPWIYKGLRVGRIESVDFSAVLRARVGFDD